MPRLVLNGSHGYIEGTLAENEKGVIQSAELLDDRKLYFKYGDGEVQVESSDGQHFSGRYSERGSDRGKREGLHLVGEVESCILAG